MKERNLIPLAITYKNELISLFKSKLIDEVELIKGKIEKLDLKYPIGSYLIITEVSEKYCMPLIPSKDQLPEWFQEFLLDCYFDAQENIQSM